MCIEWGSLEGCDDDKIECMKYGPCINLLVHLRSQSEFVWKMSQGISIDFGDSEQDEEDVL